MPRLYLATATLLVVGLIGALTAMVFWPRPDDPFASCRTSRVAGGSGDIGGPFELVDARSGRSVTDAEVFTRPTLLYFGYTFCPDVCPLDNARNAMAVEVLEEQRGIQAQPAFISIDPARDTVEVMADFADVFHPRMVALTGTEAQVRAAAQAYRVYFAAQPAEDDWYLVNHTTLTYLVLPRVGFVEVFRREVTPEAMASATACFIDAAARYRL
jgi:protein SCO1